MAALYTSHTSEDERLSLLQEYQKPDSSLKILISVEALAKGFDVADVSCIVDCRPLRKSLSTVMQMWGRGLRCAPDKKDCRLLCHSGNVERFLDDFTDVYFNGLASLDSGERLDKEIRRDAEEEKIVRKCPACGFKPFMKRCLACGFQNETSSLVQTLPGHMQPVMMGKKKLADDQRHLFEQVVAYARAFSKPEKQEMRARNLFREMTGDWPPRHWSPGSVPEGLNINQTVLNKIRQLNIAYKKSLEKRS